MRLLCISDIHGRADALAAVLATAEKRSYHKLLVAGDLVFPGTGAMETWRRLAAAHAILVQGVTDRAIGTLDPAALAPKTDHERAMLERMISVRAELGDVILERLRRLPKTYRLTLEDGRELLLVHGSPKDPTESITFDMSDEELSSMLATDPADVVVCGMSHVPFDRMLEDVRVINVGSVGEAPPDGRFAHATWIETEASGISVEQISVPLG